MKTRGFREAMGRAMDKEGLTLAEIARQTGLAVSSLKDYMASETFNPRISSLMRVAVVLAPILKTDSKKLFKSFFKDDLDRIAEARKSK
jgi:transcriptional regulator with XRE-family HTH domain